MQWKCCKCDEMAIWMYLPMSSRSEEERYWCDTHISRGCSCNINYETLEEDKDEQGRLFPCCEYIFDDRGFDKG